MERLNYDELRLFSSLFPAYHFPACLSGPISNSVRCRFFQFHSYSRFITAA